MVVKFVFVDFVPLYFAWLLILFILISGMRQFVSCNVFPDCPHCCRRVQVLVHSGNPFPFIVDENTLDRLLILYPTL